MQKLKIIGGRRLEGEISVHGAKNSALPLLCACVTINGRAVLKNCPRLSDTYAACRILTSLGAKALREGDVVTVDAVGELGYEVADSLMREMRSSIVFLGAILGRKKRCRLSFPGGCELGPRPIDIHIAALKKLGVRIKEEYGVLDCTAPRGLHGAKIALPFPSVGATENIMLAACTAKGETVIENAAREPEIKDLADFLKLAGARIKGAGTGRIIISGTERLHGCEFKVMPDRIVAATYMAAAAATCGELNVKNAAAGDLQSVIPVFEEMGCEVFPLGESVYISAKKRPKAVRSIRTMPYPGFPTDAQAIVTVPLCIADGTSVVVENIFENRFRHVDELIRMGARIKTEGRVAVIDGVPKLYGATLRAADLRAGAALIIAALSAEGESEVLNLNYIDRGYERIEKAFSSIGGRIKRISE